MKRLVLHADSLLTATSVVRAIFGMHGSEIAAICIERGTPERWPVVITLDGPGASSSLHALLEWATGHGSAMYRKSGDLER